jgi:predicted DNA-binding transcriptional regulator AlpA
MDDQTPLPGLEPLISVQQLAAHLGVPVQRIYDWRLAGTGPRGYRFGRELRFALPDVQRWLSERAEHAKTR